MWEVSIKNIDNASCERLGELSAGLGGIGRAVTLTFNICFFDTAKGFNVGRILDGVEVELEQIFFFFFFLKGGEHIFKG